MHVQKFAWSRLGKTAWRNRQELVAAGLTSRRDLLKLGLLTGTGMLILKHGLSSRVADAKEIASPKTTPFVDELKIPKVHQPLSSINNLSPFPTVAPNWLGGEGRWDDHQAFSGRDAALASYFGNLAAIPKVYETRIRACKSRVCSSNSLAEQELWGYGGAAPGLTYHARYGEQMLVRYWNELPQEPGTNGGFGRPWMSTHLHNGHNPAESDGFPLHFYPNKDKAETRNARFYDHHYPNALAGFASTHKAVNPLNGLAGDPNEAMSTLWYHDHCEHYTAQNTYKGLSGFYLMFNDKDGGNENDPNGFRLPGVRGSSFYDPVEYDIPLMICDRVFEPSSGKLYYDLFENDGILGDKFLVNGTIQPFMKVKPRRYRFRVLSGGPSRFYQLFLTDKATNTSIPFWQIANDGNLLPRPIKVTSASMSVAERVDVVIDFSKWKGKTLYIENRLIQTDGRGADYNMGDPLALRPAGAGDFILQFRVDAGSVEDNSVDFEANPNVKFYDLPERDSSPRITRNFRFNRFNGVWMVNGKAFNPKVDGQRIEPGFYVKQNTSEVWTVQNNSGGWMHPVHTHMEEFQMLKRNGKVIGPGNVEYSRKDCVRLQHGEVNTLQWRFRDFTGVYPMHCHNTLHEDNAMMIAFEVGATGDSIREP